MSYIVSDFTYIHSYHEGKKGYIDKHEKSLKLPFMNVLSNHLPQAKPNNNNDLMVDAYDVAINDKIELSSAVVSATDAGGDANAGSLSGGAT